MRALLAGRLRFADKDPRLVGLNKLEQPAILFGRPVALASRSTGHFPSTRFDKTEVTPFAHCWPSSCRPECWRFRSQPIANFYSIRISSCAFSSLMRTNVSGPPFSSLMNPKPRSAFHIFSLLAVILFSLFKPDLDQAPVVRIQRVARCAAIGRRPLLSGWLGLTRWVRLAGWRWCRRPGGYRWP